jgi:Tripartite tricarboxylate transporter family receptor
MKELLRCLGIDASKADAWQRGFFRLGNLHHGVGQFAWYPRRTNKNASTWTSDHDLALLREVMILRQQGLSERRAVKKLVADPKKRELFPSALRRSFELKSANIFHGAQGMGRSAAGKFASVVAIAALALIVRPSATDAQGFPSKPVRIIVPYTPGSPNDVMVRLLAQQLQGKLGQAVVIDNKPGGGTTIGSKAAAVAPPDGYTLLFASSALVVEPILNKQIEYDPEKDFTPIAFIARNSCLLAINAEVPANSVKEFVAYAKANPGKLSLGFAQGTVSQLLGEYFNRLHGLDITSVPYRGGHSSFPTCWAAASMSIGRRPRRSCRSFGRAGSKRWPRRARNAIPIWPTCPP